jgi:hypothetical protein
MHSFGENSRKRKNDSLGSTPTDGSPRTGSWSDAYPRVDQQLAHVTVPFTSPHCEAGCLSPLPRATDCHLGGVVIISPPSPKAPAYCGLGGRALLHSLARRMIVIWVVVPSPSPLPAPLLIIVLLFNLAPPLWGG